MPDDKVRLDKWLWAARFYKTRTAATEAVHGGKIEVNGERAKAAHPVHVSDIVRVRMPPYEYTLTVTALAERRGSAIAAAALYQESDESRQERERRHEQLRLAPSLEFTSGKPSKKDRRALEKVRGRK